MNNTIDFKTAKTIDTMSKKIDHIDDAVTGFFSFMHTAMQNELASTDVFFAAVSPVLDLTVIQPEEAPHILPCFDEDDAGYGISKEEPLGFRYNPKQVIKLMGKRYLTGPVIFHRYTDDGKFAPLTMSDMFAIQKYLETASVTLMVDADDDNPMMAYLVRAFWSAFWTNESLILLKPNIDVLPTDILEIKKFNRWKDNV